MLDPTREDAIAYAQRALDEGLRDDLPVPRDASLRAPRRARRARLRAGGRPPRRHRGPIAVFVHCGVLSVGVRKKLGLPSPFDMRFGNPLDLHALALKYPTVPIIDPALRRRHAARSADAGRLAAPTCISTPRARIRGSSTRRGSPSSRCSRPRSTWSDPIDCCSAPTRRSSRADGTGEIYEKQKTALDAIGVGKPAAGKNLRRQLRAPILR